jgi:signal peptidase I
MALRRELFDAVLDVTLRRGIPYWWRPRGFSMRPVIEDGDRVLVAPLEPARLRSGDIVKFRFGDELRMHRLLARRGERLVFRGDATAEEEVVDAEAIIGLAVAVQRDGRIRKLSRSPFPRVRIFIQRAILRVSYRIYGEK